MKRTILVLAALALTFAAPARAQNTIDFTFGVGGVGFTHATLSQVDFFTLSIGENFTSGRAPANRTYFFEAYLQGDTRSPTLSGNFTTDAEGRMGATFESGLFTPVVANLNVYDFHLTILNPISNIDGVAHVTLGNSLAVTATPEPASLALLATGLAGLGGVIRRRRA